MTAAAVHTSRPFRAGNFAFGFRTDSVDDLATFSELFDDLPNPPPAIDPAWFDIKRLHRGADCDRQVEGPRLQQRTISTLADCLAALMSAINICALDADPEHLHLHAGAATTDNAATVIAAPRDTGKTTTIANLVRLGWDFMTDEMVTLGNYDEVSGITKPLSIKPGGHLSVPHLTEHLVPAFEAGRNTYGFVRIGRTGANVVERSRAHMLVLLRRPDGPQELPVLEQVHPVDATVQLMQETLDADRFGTATRRLAELCATTPCYSLTVGTPERTAETIDQLARTRPDTALTVVEYAQTEQFNELVESVKIGTRAIVRHTGTGLIFALDDIATQVWEQLGDFAEHGIDTREVGLRPFLKQLNDLDVLIPER